MVKISALPPNNAPDGNDDVPGVDDSSGSTIKWTLTTIKEWLQGLVGWITTAMLGDGAVTPVKRSGGFYEVHHTFPETAGTETITGVPFAPKAIITRQLHADDTNAFRRADGSAVLNSDDTITQSCSYGIAQGSNYRSYSTNAYAFAGWGGAVINHRIEVTAFNSDGITVNLDAAPSSAQKVWSIIFLG